MSNLNPKIAYYSANLQGSLSMAVLQRECGGTFVSNRSTTLKYFRKLYPDVKTTRRYRYLNWLGGHNLLKEADAIFSGTGCHEYLPQFSAKKFMLFHGTFGCLTENFFKHSAHFDHLYLIGQRMEEQFLRFNHKYNLPYSTTGFLPFALYPNKTEETRHEILSKLGLDSSLKTVVYTPSKASVGTWLHSAKNIAIETPLNFNLILRPHPNQALSGSSKDLSSFKKIKATLRDRKNGIIDLSICSLPELECIADVMITDANSPAEESLFYDCTQLFSDTHLSSKKTFAERLKEEHMHPDDIEKYLKIFDCGPKFYSDRFTHWGKAILAAIEKKEDYASARTEYFQYVFGKKDRNASKRVAEKTSSLLCQ